MKTVACSHKLFKKLFVMYFYCVFIPSQQKTSYPTTTKICKKKVIHLWNRANFLLTPPVLYKHNSYLGVRKWGNLAVLCLSVTMMVIPKPKFCLIKIEHEIPKSKHPVVEHGEVFPSPICQNLLMSRWHRILGQQTLQCRAL